MLNPINLISKIFKSSNQKELNNLAKIVAKINLLEEETAKLDDDDFINKTLEFREKYKKGIKLSELLPEAYSLVREASKRIYNERHFDAQLMGGIVLNNNKIAEMKTGEGKTLTIALAAYLNSLENKGVHVVTVNDYLAKRDSENMGRIYKFLGLTCGYINSGQTDDERRKNYSCDITYATNSELGFDYLRDNMKFSQEDMVQRGHNYAIVDEIDSCLIDEARVPLIISGQAEDKTDQYVIVNKLIKKLNNEDFDIDEKGRNILLTNRGIDSVEKIFSEVGILKNNNFYDPENLSLVHLVNQSLRAHYIFSNGKDYIVKDKEIVIIDEQTGRQMPGRRFGDGLHQSLEAKENLNIQFENQTLASITYQNYFKLYNKLCGCTGTAITEAQEFFEIYNLSVITIPTNKEMIRKDWNDQIYRTLKEKDEAIVNLVSEKHILGQPILVFTSSINKSEHYSEMFKKKNINHIVLNAKNHDKEAQIIADAGAKGSVIITTSISGRGVDIQLGGKKGDKNDEKLKIEKEKVKSLGGLFVIGTERMESRRVDNQARGRAGRQGDEGNSVFFVSLEDDLMRIFGSESMTNMLEKLGLKDGESIDHPWINKALERAQQKVEARNFDIRKTLIKFDNVLNDQRHVIFSQRKDAMNSDKIFNYSNEFLEEILDNIIKTKVQNSSNLNNNEFSNKVRTILGKSVDDKKFFDICSLNNIQFKEKIVEIFNNSRNERIKFLHELDYMSLLSLYKRSSTFVHLAYLDHCPNVVVDARASGCKIVCSTAGGTREIAGTNALIIEEDNWDMSPVDLYNPPQINFDKVVDNNINTDYNMKVVANKYIDFMRQSNEN